MNKHARRTGVVALALLAAGCQPLNGSGSGIEIVPVAAQAKANVFFGAPSISQIKPANGMGRLNFKLKIKESTDPISAHYGLLALPDGAGGTAANMAASVFTEAVVTLHSTSVSGTYDPLKHSITLLKAAFSTVADGAGYFTASGTFGSLRPAADYVSRIFLRNNAGTIATNRLGASASNTGVSIQAGPNNVDFTCTINGQEATYNMASSSFGNNVSDGGIVKGDTLTFNTGMANNQPGVTRLDVELSGAAYPGGTIVKRITTPASFASVTWDTSANSGGAGETYLAASLVAPASGTTGNAGRLDIVAYNSNGTEVGRSAFAITVFGLPTTTIRIK